MVRSCLHPVCGARQRINSFVETYIKRLLGKKAGRWVGGAGGRPGMLVKRSDFVLFARRALEVSVQS